MVTGGSLWWWVSTPVPAAPSAVAAPTAALAEPSLPAGAGNATPQAAPVEVAPTSESMAAESAPAGVPLDPPLPVEPAPVGSPPAPIGVEDLVARTGAAVVMVEAGASRGTGFFVRSDLIVTNDHVVAGQTAVTVRMHDGRAISARVERTVPDVDLALLRTAAGAAAAVLSLGQAANVRTGQEVIAIGSALGLQNTVTRGIISARRRAGSVVLLQTDAAINPGNSGGPLLDRQGVVLGVTTLKMGGPAEGLGFAVAADHVTALVEGRASSLVATAAGAPPPAPSAAAAPNALSGFGTERSSADDHRELGAQAFEREMAEAGQQAAQIDGYWARFTAACAPRVRSTGDRPWFGLADGRVDYTGNDGNCPYWLNDLVSMSRDFGLAMRTAGDAARRAGVFPGTLRDVRRKHRLDWIGFDR